MGNRSVFEPPEMAALCAAGKPRRYRSGECLFNEGDPSDYVVVIRRGKVKISSVSPAGYEAVLAVRTAGEIVGELAALDGRPRSASVFAMEDIDGVLVSGERFRAFLHQYPAAALALLRRVVVRLRESDRRRVEFGAYDVASRVARLLLELAGRHGLPAADGTGTTISVPLAQHELAGSTGASREAVSRALRQLRESGAIATGRRRITVLRPEVLRRFTVDQHADGG